ncbi:Protein N-acetyltransferase, RimJ/RimL family [Peptoclostridium litorale DSM 5388]|uniref:GCN5-like N-acetyltransferase n=1 Tax=Peptoclostridium litorale DSM 5388 TaxID=1121324 RepID=A0A069RDW4_PEPLI|nr:GNAT family protein [Peptoclostridium litorale]KDR95264.1 GCN5-like N-acetyltransferase [Peptoclostridium litorale DSM 5388]SIN72532.1 Protein N-acetyltransferase, RimJ/RimL family [Peptoclostridium litorale DSM 5388]
MITGEKTIIRQLEAGDEKYFYKWRNDVNVMGYSELKYGFLMSLDAFRIGIQKYIQSTEMFPEEKMFMICKKQDMLPIGDITYRNWDKRNRSAELGIEIGDMDERKKGYGKDALINFIDYMFNFLNLNKVELKAIVENEYAIKLYKEIGFTEIGVIRQAVFNSRKGSYSDILYMDILKGEWKSQFPK